MPMQDTKQTKTTLPLRDRIQILRNRLKDEIKQQIFENVDTKDKFAFSDENYDYIEQPNDKITPIIDPKIKKHRKRKHATAAIRANTMKDTSELSNVTDSQFSTPKLLRSIIKKNMKKPLDIFYRRNSHDVVNEAIPWAHCHYIITPYLSGVKKDITTSKGFGPKDPTVVRLIQLLSMNTTGMAKEDIYSILYQISHLHIRLFQWDISPIKMLLNVVIREKNHSFRTLKHSVQTLFSEWKLDISNASSLLKQTRLFRPPCVRVSDLDGSTKSPRITLYPKKLTQPSKCSDDEGDIIK
ncbi:uncharacterized protein LOC125061527 [Pieris napi]|uniref:uncharacterized protein LOC125061527 n=1 Tax=Pieris napi TaxID=78633 RepID=UPI001FBB6020|nr:uncharacterized protein LOC125061527 [Pieris napi]